MIPAPQYLKADDQFAHNFVSLGHAYSVVIMRSAEDSSGKASRTENVNQGSEPWRRSVIGDSVSSNKPDILAMKKTGGR